MSCPRFPRTHSASLPFELNRRNRPRQTTPPPSRLYLSADVRSGAIRRRASRARRLPLRQTPAPGSRRKRAARPRRPRGYVSTAKVLLTAISVISSGLRPARRAAAAIRSRTRAIFSRNRHRAKITPDTKYHDGEFLLASAPSPRPSLRSAWTGGAPVPTLGLLTSCRLVARVR